MNPWTMWENCHETLGIKFSIKNFSEVDTETNGDKITM